jgi:hypothetical protein
MLYTYVNERGRHVELSFSMGRAPEKTLINGKEYTRDHEADFQQQQFILRGSGWPSQDGKRRTQMTDASARAARRTKKTWGKPKEVVPNYEGKLTESWRETTELAKKHRERT